MLLYKNWNINIGKITGFEVDKLLRRTRSIIDIRNAN